MVKKIIIRPPSSSSSPISTIIIQPFLLLCPKKNLPFSSSLYFPRLPFQYPLSFFLFSLYLSLFLSQLPLFSAFSLYFSRLSCCVSLQVSIFEVMFLIILIFYFGFLDCLCILASGFCLLVLYDGVICWVLFLMIEYFEFFELFFIFKDLGCV